MGWYDTKTQEDVDDVEDQRQRNIVERSGNRPRVNCCDKSWKKISWGVFIVALFITGISLLATSLGRLESTEYGVEYNVHKKQLDEAAKTGGLHAGPPGFDFIKFPATYITVDLPDDTCVSKDGLRVDFSVTFQYQLPKEYVMTVITKYRNFDKWATLVESSGLSAVQYTCSEFSIIDFQSQRGAIQLQMESNLRDKLESFHPLKILNETEGVVLSELPVDEEDSVGIYARAIGLQMRNVELPREYKEAVQEKQEANEDIELAKNQRTQEITKAETELLAAKEEARRILDTANNEADLLLTEATLRAEETTFAFEKEAETILGVKTGLNLTTEGVLAYLSNQLVSEVSELKVTAGEPALLSQKNKL